NAGPRGAGWTGPHQSRLFLLTSIDDRGGPTAQLGVPAHRPQPTTLTLDGLVEPQVAAPDFMETQLHLTPSETHVHVRSSRGAHIATRASREERTCTCVSSGRAFAVGSRGRKRPEEDDL